MERVALITGASAGIGCELAKIFAGKGHRVALVARRLDRLMSFAGEFISIEAGHWARHEELERAAKTAYTAAKNSWLAKVDREEDGEKRHRFPQRPLPQRRQDDRDQDPVDQHRARHRDAIGRREVG